MPFGRALLRRGKAVVHHHPQRRGLNLRLRKVVQHGQAGAGRIHEQRQRFRQHPPLQHGLDPVHNSRYTLVRKGTLGVMHGVDGWRRRAGGRVHPAVAGPTTAISTRSMTTRAV